MKYIIFFIILILVKTLINIWYLYRTNKLESEYHHFIASLMYENVTLRDSTMEYKSEIIEVFLRSGIPRPLVPYTELAGYGYVSSGNADAWDNMFQNDQRVILLVNSAFKSARGVFKLRLKQTFNPIYWIEFVVFLPSKFFSYLGMKSDSVLIKALNILYWITIAIYTIYSDQINQMIQSFISNLFK